MIDRKGRVYYTVDALPRQPKKESTDRFKGTYYLGAGSLKTYYIIFLTQKKKRKNRSMHKEKIYIYSIDSTTPDLLAQQV